MLLRREDRARSRRVKETSQVASGPGLLGLPARGVTWSATEKALAKPSGSKLIWAIASRYFSTYSGTSVAGSASLTISAAPRPALHRHFGDVVEVHDPLLPPTSRSQPDTRLHVSVLRDQRRAGESSSRGFATLRRMCGILCHRELRELSRTFFDGGQGARALRGRTVLLGE